jgi:hypothetical protein
MNMTSDMSIECAARVGYEHALSVIDKLYPETAGRLNWETENEACKEEWRERAKQMLAPIVQENERQKSDLEVFANHLARTEGRCSLLQEALAMIEMVESNLGESIVYSVRCENPKEFMVKRAAALKGNGASDAE